MSTQTRREFMAGIAAAAVVPAFADTNSDAIHLIAIGDWGAPPGNNGDPPKKRKWQKTVATAATAYLDQEKIIPAALLALGDNFYDDLTGIDDPRWKWGFEDLYPADKWPCPVPFILGNHDYEDFKDKNWQHEIAYARKPGQSRWHWGAKDDDRWYRLDYPAGNPLVTLLMLDSNTDHLKAPGPKWQAQLDWFDEQLKSDKNAPWVIPVAHHPVWTVGYHYDEGDNHDQHDKSLYPRLRSDWLPRIKHLPFYLSAHDHNLQHVTHPGSPGLDFLISGAGGGDFPQKREAPASTKINSDFHKAFGFAHLKITKTSLTWRLIGFKPGDQPSILAEGTKAI